MAAQQSLYLPPNFAITFDLSVAFTQETATPGKPVAFCGIPFVLPKKIPEDCRARRIGGHDFSATVNQAMRLVEIHRLGDIGRNEPIILKRLCDAIYLYRQRDRDACPF